MTTVFYTDAARQDLKRIARRISADNPRAARNFVLGLRSHCGLLNSSPLMGRPRDDFGPDIHSMPHGAYMIYYRHWKARDRVDILRIWHGARQTPTLADLTFG